MSKKFKIWAGITVLAMILLWIVPFLFCNEKSYANFGQFRDGTVAKDTVWMSVGTFDTTGQQLDADSIWFIRYFRSTVVDTSILTGAGGLGTGAYTVGRRAFDGTNYGQYKVRIRWKVQTKYYQKMDFYTVFPDSGAVAAINAAAARDTSHNANISALAGRDTSALIHAEVVNINGSTPLTKADIADTIKNTPLQLTAAERGHIEDSIHANAADYKATGFSTLTKDDVADTIKNTPLQLTAAERGHIEDSIYANKANYGLTKTDVADTVSKTPLQLMAAERGHIEDSIYANRADYKATGFSTFDPATDLVVASDTNGSGDTLARQKDSTSFQGTASRLDTTDIKTMMGNNKFVSIPTDTTESGFNIPDTLANFATLGDLGSAIWTYAGRELDDYSGVWDFNIAAYSGAKAGYYLKNLYDSQNWFNPLTTPVVAEDTNASGLTLSTFATTESVLVKGNGDKTGYSLTQSFPTNFASLKISSGGYASLNFDDVYGDIDSTSFSASYWHKIANRSDSGNAGSFAGVATEILDSLRLYYLLPIDTMRWYLLNQTSTSYPVVAITPASDTNKVMLWGCVGTGESWLSGVKISITPEVETGEYIRAIDSSFVMPPVSYSAVSYGGLWWKQVYRTSFLQKKVGDSWQDSVTYKITITYPQNTNAEVITNFTAPDTSLFQVRQ